MLNSFAMIFGHCVWVPPSFKAALVALLWFSGAAPNVPWAEEEALLIQQYEAANVPASAARFEVKWLEACFGSYTTPPSMRP